MITTSGNTPPASPANPPPQGHSRGIWTALILLTAVLVGAAAGLLTFAGGANVPTAVLAGGAAFAGTVLLLLVLYKFLAGEPE